MEKTTIEIVPLEAIPIPDTPKRLLRYVLIWCSEGSVRLKVDENMLEMIPGSVLTITSGQIHSFLEAKAASGFVMRFTLDFFCKSDHELELIFENGLFCHFGENEVIAIDKTYKIEEQLREIAEEVARQPYQHLISIHARIALILVEINRSRRTSGAEIWKPDALFLKFLEMIRGNFDKNYSVAQFAELLNTTEFRLNEQSRLHTGKTAQQVIYSLLISEARRLLTHEKLIVKEVAFQLGFSDPFYFSNFFKKHTGLSPSRYQALNAL